MEIDMIVTRHAALREYLIEIGIATAETPVVAHATAEALKGKRVVGVLPLHLASAAETVTEIPMAIPPELRGQELSLEQTRQYAGAPRTYRVTVE